MSEAPPVDRLGVQFQRVVNLSKVLMVLLIAAVALAAFLFTQQRELRDATYESCLATSRASVSASEARIVMSQEFVKLGSLTRASEAFTIQESRARDESYMKMAVALDLAVQDIITADECETLK